MMKQLLYFAGAALMASSASAKGINKLKKKTDAKPRNVVFILSDDHRYDFMGFMGKVPWLETPNMDRMAKEGAHIQNAFCTTALSSPSRASILTGLYSHTHTVVDNLAPIPENLVFFPQYLQKSGYHTGYFGKWHMGNADDNPQPGFDYWESFRGQGEYDHNELNINGKRQFFENEYITDLLTEHCIAWMKEQKKDGKPFFAYLSHKGVHHRFKPADRHKDRYKDKPVIYPESFNTPDYNDITHLPTMKFFKGKRPAVRKEYYGENYLPDWLKAQRESWHGIDYLFNGEFDFDTLFRRYCETLLSIDESIGDVLDFLKEEGLDENTVVIYMGDNGFTMGEHGIIDKRHFYEESVRVPLLLRAPGLIEPETKVTKMIQNIDMAPTMLEFCGLQAPDYMQGKSFIPFMQGKEIPWRNQIFYEYYWEQDFPQCPTTFGVRGERYKYIRYHGVWDTNEFYDLENDPHEMHNLIDRPEYQDTIRKYLSDLYTWLEQTGGMQIPLKRIEVPKFDHRNGGLY